MICPEGYFTPKMLETRFEKALSSDRISPQVFASAGGNFDRVPPNDRAAVMRICTVLLVQRFLEMNRSDLLVYTPSRLSPLKIDSWILRTAGKLPNALPESAQQAEKSLDAICNVYPFLSVNEWSISSCSTVLTPIALSKAETKCLEVIDGWSLCLSDNNLPTDFGASTKSIAAQMARDAIVNGDKKRGPGRTSKADALVDRLKRLYPKGIPNKTANEITRDLGKDKPSPE